MSATPFVIHKQNEPQRARRTQRKQKGFFVSFSLGVLCALCGLNFLRLFNINATTDKWTVLRLINWTKDYFTRSGIDEPRLAAEVLLGYVLGCKRVALYTQFDRAPTDEQLSAFRQLVRRAADGEPIAYLTGQKEFYSLTIKVTPDVLIPRPETELLVDAVLDYARERTDAVRLWDVCTGSGCVAVAAAKHCPTLTVLATDISEAALAVARENVERHDLVNRVRLEHADLLTWPQTPLPRHRVFDIITSNPPYVTDAEMEQLPDPVKREPEAALRAGPTGLEFITRIIKDAPNHLQAAPSTLLGTGGLLAVEIGFDQAERVYDLLNEAGRYENIRFGKDPAGIERIALAQIISD